MQAIADYLFGGLLFLLFLKIVEGDEDDDEKPMLLTGTHAFGSEKRGESELSQRSDGGGLVLRLGTAQDGVRVPIRKLDPAAIQIGAWADFVRAMKRQESAGLTPGEMTEMVGRNFKAQVSDKSYAQGIEDMMNLYLAVSDPERKLGSGAEALVRFGRETASPIVPNIIKQPMRQLDDNVRSTWEKPWYYDFLPYHEFGEPKIDLYGNPVRRQLSGGNQRILRVLWDAGFEPSSPNEEFDDFLESFIRLGKEWPESRSIPAQKTSWEYRTPNQRGAVRMTPEEARKFNEKVGKRFAKESRERLTFSDVRNPSEEKLIELLNLLESIREDVRYEMFPGQAEYERLSSAEKARLPR